MRVLGANQKHGTPFRIRGGLDSNPQASIDSKDGRVDFLYTKYSSFACPAMNSQLVVWLTRPAPAQQAS